MSYISRPTVKLLEDISVALRNILQSLVRPLYVDWQARPGFGTVTTPSVRVNIVRSDATASVQKIYQLGSPTMNHVDMRTTWALVNRDLL